MLKSPRLLFLLRCVAHWVNHWLNMGSRVDGDADDSLLLVVDFVVVVVG